MLVAQELHKIQQQQIYLDNACFSSYLDLNCELYCLNR